MRKVLRLLARLGKLLKRFYFIGRAKYFLGTIAERHPYTWFVIRHLLHRLIIFLPHDESYYAFQYLSSDGEGLLIDIGANDGISALSFRRFNKTYKILSMEPNLSHEAKLKNVKSRINDFDYLMVGAGDHEEEIELYVPVYRGVAIHPAACVNYELLKETMKTLYPAFISSKIDYVKQTVKIITIDSLDLNPALVKIDAEGADYRVLLGMRRTIDRARPCILLELSPDMVGAVKQFCHERDYVMFSYNYKIDKFIPFEKQHLRNVTGGRNAFCIPVEKMAILPVVASEDDECQ